MTTPAPSVDEIAGLVARLLASEWPTTEAERVAWFERHGLGVSGTEPRQRGRREYASESWVSGDPGAHWPGVGWHVFEGEFVGVSWFLWYGLPEDVAPGLAEELRTRLVELAGEPVDELRREGDDYRFTAYWETGGRIIDMYLHGGPVMEGQHHEDPVVQLHVDHVERARRADEAVSRAHPVVMGRDGPVDVEPPYPATSPR